jgi:hypothetical protein
VARLGSALDRDRRRCERSRELISVRDGAPRIAAPSSEILVGQHPCAISRQKRRGWYGNSARCRHGRSRSCLSDRSTLTGAEGIVLGALGPGSSGDPDPGHLLNELHDEIRPHLSFHRPRPRCRETHLQPGRGYVSRQDRRGRGRRGMNSRTRGASASVHHIQHNSWAAYGPHQTPNVRSQPQTFEVVCPASRHDSARLEEIGAPRADLSRR